MKNTPIPKRADVSKLFTLDITLNDAYFYCFPINGLVFSLPIQSLVSTDFMCFVCWVLSIYILAFEMAPKLNSSLKTFPYAI